MFRLNFIGNWFNEKTLSYVVLNSPATSIYTRPQPNNLSQFLAIRIWLTADRSASLCETYLYCPPVVPYTPRALSLDFLYPVYLL